MKKLLTILVSLALSATLLIRPVFAVLNTNSADIELSGDQSLSILDGNQTDLNLTTDFSLVTWINLESNSGAYEERAIISRRTGSNAAYLLETYRDDDDGAQMKFLCNYYGSNGVTQAETDLNLNLATWLHVVVTCDVSANLCIFYQNGSTSGTTMNLTNADDLGAGSATFYIGSYTTGADRSFDGKVDDMRIYDFELSQAQVTAIYESGEETDGSTEVGAWRFNGADPFTNNLLDQTTNNNDLTNNNAVTWPSDVPFPGTGTAVIPKRVQVQLLEG